MDDQTIHAAVVITPQRLRITAMAACAAALVACGGDLGEGANPLAGGPPVVAAPAVASASALTPPVLVAAPQPLIVADGEPATFVVTAQGRQLHYRWTINGSVLPGLDAPVLRLAAALRADDGAQIAVMAFNDAGAVAAPAVRLTVEPAGWRAPWH